MLAVVGGTDPGSVDWAEDVRNAVRGKGLRPRTARGKIVELAKT